MDKQLDPQLKASIPAPMLDALLSEMGQAEKVTPESLDRPLRKDPAPVQTLVKPIAITSLIFLAIFFAAGFIFVPRFGSFTGMHGLAITTVGVGYIVAAGLSRYTASLRRR